MDKDLLRDRFTGPVMNSLHNVAVLVAMVVLIGSIGATSLQSQVFALINQDKLIKFKELTTNFEMDVSTAAAKNDMKVMRVLLDEYNRNVMIIFGLEPPEPDSDQPDETESSEDDDEPRTPGTR